MDAQILLEAFPVVVALIKNLLIFNFVHASTAAAAATTTEVQWQLQGEEGRGVDVRLATLHNCKNNRA